MLDDEQNLSGCWKRVNPNPADSASVSPTHPGLPAKAFTQPCQWPSASKQSPLVPLSTPWLVTSLGMDLVVSLPSLLCTPLHGLPPPTLPARRPRHPCALCASVLANLLPSLPHILPHPVHMLAWLLLLLTLGVISAGSASPSPSHLTRARGGEPQNKKSPSALFSPPVPGKPLTRT